VAGPVPPEGPIQVAGDTLAQAPLLTAETGAPLTVQPDVVSVRNTRVTALLPVLQGSSSGVSARAGPARAATATAPIRSFWILFMLVLPANISPHRV